MYIFYKIYLQWTYWTLFFVARCSTIFANKLPEVHGEEGTSSWCQSQLMKPILVYEAFAMVSMCVLGPLLPTINGYNYKVVATTSFNK